MVTILSLILFIQTCLKQHGTMNHSYHKEILLPQIVEKISQINPTEFEKYQTTQTTNVSLEFNDIFVDPTSLCINVMRLSKNVTNSIHYHSPYINIINYLLKGKIRHQYFDIITSDHCMEDIIAKECDEEIISVGQTFNTYHNEKNLHTFTALEESWIFGILIPFYDDVQRYETRFNIIPTAYVDHDGKQLVRLTKLL
eukprot:312882_1